MTEDGVADSLTKSTRIKPFNFPDIKGGGGAKNFLFLLYHQASSVPTHTYESGLTSLSDNAHLPS